jgi:hypothetical protein
MQGEPSTATLWALEFVFSGRGASFGDSNEKIPQMDGGVAISSVNIHDICLNMAWMVVFFWREVRLGFELRASHLQSKHSTA